MHYAAQLQTTPPCWAGDLCVGGCVSSEQTEYEAQESNGRQKTRGLCREEYGIDRQQG